MRSQLWRDPSEPPPTRTGWKYTWSKEFKAWYWYKPGTKTTTWTDPNLLPKTNPGCGGDKTSASSVPQGELRLVRAPLSFGPGVRPPGAGVAKFVRVVRTLPSGAELSLEINISGVKESGDSAVLTAAAAGDVATVRLLVEQGADPALADAGGCTPFFAACRGGHQGVAQYLFEQHDVDPRQANEDGCSPLRAACEGSHLTLAWWLTMSAKPGVATDWLGDGMAFWVDSVEAKLASAAWRSKCVQEEERVATGDGRAEEKWACHLAERQWRHAAHRTGPPIIIRGTLVAKAAAGTTAARASPPVHHAACMR